MSITWRDELQGEMASNQDQGPVIAFAPDESSFDVKIENRDSESPHVLAWTEMFVYFPVTCDGAEWLGSAPRNPTPYGQTHVGGE